MSSIQVFTQYVPFKSESFLVTLVCLLYPITLLASQSSSIMYKCNKKTDVEYVRKMTVSGQRCLNKDCDVTLGH